MLALLARIKCPALNDVSVPGLLLPTDIAMPLFLYPRKQAMHR